MDTKSKKLYKISEVANFFEITPTTLRYYEDFGLLTPAKIDKDSKYRYYDIANINKIAYILTMRRFGMNMQETKHYILDSTDKISLQAHLNRLIQQRDALNSFIDKIQIRLSSGNAYNVTKKTIPAQYCYNVSNYSKTLPDLYNNFLEFLEEAVRNTTINQDVISYIQFDTIEPVFDNLNVIFGIETGFVQKRNTTLRPALNGIYTLHKGSYESIGNAYAALIEYANKNNIELTGSAIEYYHESFNLRAIPDEFLTEVFLITK